jgi:hypothetical protein
VVGLDARPGSATATAKWTVNFTGHGTSQSDATLTFNGGCPTTDNTTVKSAFHWSLTWEHVALSVPPVTGPITGAMLGTAYETETKKVTGSCCGDVNCNKIVLVVHKGAFNFPTAGDEDCSDTTLGLKCSQSQSWSGTVTLTRAS